MSNLNVSTEDPPINEKTMEKELAQNPSLSSNRNKRCNMKVLVVVPKYAPKTGIKNPPYFLPIGLMYLSSYMKKYGFTVDCLNLNHYPDDKLEMELMKNSYDVMCTGGMFTDIAQIATVVKTTQRVNPATKVVIGGALPSGDPEFAVEYLKPDFVVIGEGEKTICNLISAIQDGSDLATIKGIAFFDSNGKYCKTHPQDELISDLDQIPYPDYESFEFEHYLKYHSANDVESRSTFRDAESTRPASVISSRNCVAKCTFCFRLMTGGYRMRSLDAVMAEIKYLVDKYHANEMTLADEMFAYNKERIYEFCKKIKPFGIRWQVQLRVNVIDKDLLAAMKDAGCHRISYGFESGSKKVLKSMKKGVHITMIENAIRWTSEIGMTIQGNFIFGDPAETLETMMETIRFRRKFRTINFGFGLIIPYPGTILYKNLKEKGEFTDLVEFYKNPSSVFNSFPLNMTSLSPVDFRFMCRKVSLEGKISFIPGKVLASKKIDSNTSIIDFQCPNCSEKHRNCKVDVNGKLIFICKKCYQKVVLYRSDVTFDLYDRLRYIYRRFILRPMLFNSATHKFFEPLIIQLEGHGKIGARVKRFLRKGMVVKAEERANIKPKK